MLEEGYLEHSWIHLNIRVQATPTAYFPNGTHCQFGTPNNCLCGEPTLLQEVLHQGQDLS